MKTYMHFINIAYRYNSVFGHRPFVDMMRGHRIGINLFKIGVRYDVTVSPRQEYLGRVCPFAPYSDHHSGAESCSLSFSPENAILTIDVQFGDRNCLFARDTFKLLGQVRYVSERKASYTLQGFRMCVINSLLDIGRKTQPCVNDGGQAGRGHDVCRRHTEIPTTERKYVIK